MPVNQRLKAYSAAASADPEIKVMTSCIWAPAGATAPATPRSVPDINVPRTWRRHRIWTISTG